VDPLEEVLMRVLRDPAVTGDIGDPEIRALAYSRFSMLDADGDYDPDIYGYFIVVEEGDSLEALDRQLGFPILSNRFDGRCFEEAGFTPSFEILEEHVGCYEMVFVLSDDGYGVEVFIPKTVAIPVLIAMCRRYAVPAEIRSAP